VEQALMTVDGVEEARVALTQVGKQQHRVAHPRTQAHFHTHTHTHKHTHTYTHEPARVAAGYVRSRTGAS
jgi:type III secretory pathway lipoprotein EscJ